MKKTCVLFLSVIICYAIVADAARAENLPDGLVRTIIVAKNTENSYVFNAVVAAIKSDNAAFAKDVDAYVSLLNKQRKTEDKAAEVFKPQIASVELLNNISPAANVPAKEQLWDGSVEFGANVKTGNTEKQTLNVKAKLNNYYGQWENTIKFAADLGEENGNSTDEEYRISDQLRYTLSTVDYAFGEFEYVNDRFSGFEYRTSELLGYGRHLVKNDRLSVIGEIGAGARQAAVEGGDDENSFLGRVGSKIEWKVSDTINLTEELTVSLGAESVITESETALKSNITDDLYLKVSYDLEHISDVPADRENLDTVTKVTVGYDF